MPHHLLLADDSVTIQRVIKLTFADEDVEVVTVGDGDQAVAAIDKTPPDIVLADVAMPGRTGYDVAAHIRKTPRLAHIPVVLLTGAFEPVDEMRASQVGCDAVLAKPFEPEVVVSRVRELLSRPRSNGTATGLAEPPRSSPETPRAPVASKVVAPAGAAPVPARVVALPSSAPPLPKIATQVAESPVITAPMAASATAGPVAVPAPPMAAGAAKGNSPADIDAYFDRLDEAFANLSSAPKSTPALPTSDARSGSALSLVSPAGGARAASLVVGDSSEPAVRSLVDAFDGLIGAGSGADGAQGSRAAAPAPPGLTDAQLGHIVDQVVERLADRLGGRDLGEVVDRLAERLIREEIAEIKKRL